MKNKVLLLAFAAFTLAAIFSVVSNFLTPLSPTLLFAARWIAIATLAVYAFYKRSLRLGFLWRWSSARPSDTTGLMSRSTCG